MRLIDADKLKDNIVITDPNGMTSSDMYRINQLKKWIDNQPTVEAIPKADYENRLKADMAAMLEMIRQDLLDKLVEERSEYHISDVGIGLERALKTVDEYIVGTNGESLKGEPS